MAPENIAPTAPPQIMIQIFITEIT